MIKINLLYETIKKLVLKEPQRWGLALLILLSYQQTYAQDFFVAPESGYTPGGGKTGQQACDGNYTWSSFSYPYFYVFRPFIDNPINGQCLLHSVESGNNQVTGIQVYQGWRCPSGYIAINSGGGMYLNPNIIASESNPYYHYNSDVTCKRPPVDVTKIAGDPKCNGTKNPINISTGNKYLGEVDFQIANKLSFERHYNYSGDLLASQSTNSVTYLGNRWRTNYFRNLLISESAPNYATISAVRNDGKTVYFTKSIGQSVWAKENDGQDTILEIKNASNVRTGWTYTTDSTGEIETYDATGKLLSITDRAGVTLSLSYDFNNRIATVSDALGDTLHFSYDASNRIASMTNPAGGVYNYTYSTNGSNNLASVTYPDKKTKSYLYGEAANVSNSPVYGITYTNALTGIIDENGSRYATYRYDSAGRAYDEELAPELGVASGQLIEHNNLVYNVDGSGNPTSTIVTDPLGSSRTYNFTTILGVVKSTGQSQPAGSGCAASAAALTYDANGNVASRTDFKGNKTTFVYDLARNLEISRTEGLTTSNGGTTNLVTTATRTITTSYHPTWRLPLVTTEYSGGTSNLSDGSGTPTGVALRSTTNVYDTKGNLTSITEADPVRSTSRTTTLTYTYSTLVPGLVLTKVIDGPRTDVSDISTYHYYEADSTCTPSAATPLIDPITNTSPANLGCRGQLQSMTDALGHTTSYDRYNHHGQVEQMTDANGLVTANTYDLRQRLLTRSVTGSGIVTQTTSLTYDGVGQVTQLTMPDSSSLNYSYDAAHRLTQVQDSLGNKVSYTLDSEGNRINETTTDPQNVLTKTLTRSYDALNRLQQVIGVQ